MSGLEQPSQGRVFLGERDVTDVPPRGRDIAMVFQSYALYPQFSVADNIAYPLRIRKVPKAQKAAEVARVADLLGLTPLLNRKPRQLSGGERQRVALARAIIRRPAAFLMDEPLSNLDAQLRIQMRTEIKRLQKELAVTTLYVTHDQVEAMTMADSVAIMHRGKLQQHATPAKLYAQPANTFVARFVGSPPMNILSGSVTEGVFRCPGAEIAVGPTAPAGDVQLGFRPEAAAIVAASEPGVLPARVYTVEPLGNEVIVSFLIGDTIVHVRAAADTSIAMGDSCGLRFDLRRVHLFNPTDGQRIDWVA
jgi:multiple sugar transport system ATP-binding protein